MLHYATALTLKIEHTLKQCRPSRPPLTELKRSKLFTATQSCLNLLLYQKQTRKVEVVK